MLCYCVHSGGLFRFEYDDLVATWTDDNASSWSWCCCASRTVICDWRTWWWDLSLYILPFLFCFQLKCILFVRFLAWSYLNTVERYNRFGLNHLTHFKQHEFALNVNGLFTNYRWDPIRRTWSAVASMSFMRMCAGVSVLNNRLFVCGGRDGSASHRSVESYDPHTNKWTLRSPMIQRRSGVAVAVLNGFLYALGKHFSF